MSRMCKNCVMEDHRKCDHDDCQCEKENHDYEKLKNQHFEDDPLAPIEKPVIPSYTFDKDGRPIFKIKRSDSDRIDIVAEMLIKKYKFVTARESDILYLYTGKIYDTQSAIAIIKEETEQWIANCKKNDPQEVEAKIKRKTYTDLKNFDSDSNLITLENGILDLRTMELKPHTPTNLSRILIPCNFTMPKSQDIENNLEKTLFWKYLTKSFTVDEKLIEEDMMTVLEIMASVFLKTDVDEKSVMFLGKGENGKSTCLDFIKYMLGFENYKAIPLQVIQDDKYSASNLDGCHANIFPDLEDGELKHTGTFKTLSSQEEIYAQHKYGQPFTLVPFATLIFSANRFPKTKDQEKAFFRRWIIVKWQVDFENNPDRIDDLKPKLLSNPSERDLVFSSLMLITKKLLDSNKFSYSKKWRQTQKDWNENSDPLDDFANNYIIDSEDSKEKPAKTKRETHQFYKKIMFLKGEAPLGIGAFNKLFKEYFDESKSGSRRTWLDIDFKEPKQTKFEEYDRDD